MSASLESDRSAASPGSVAMCQERTHAAQQTKRIGLAYLTDLLSAVNISSHRPPYHIGNVLSGPLYRLDWGSSPASTVIALTLPHRFARPSIRAAMPRPRVSTARAMLGHGEFRPSCPRHFGQSCGFGCLN